MAVQDPMPSASVSTATAVKPGCLSSWRKANLRSFIFGFTIYDLGAGKSHEPNTKHQGPNTRKAPMLKLKAADVAARIGIWTWGFLWCLDLGIWVFSSRCLELGFWCFHSYHWTMTKSERSPKPEIRIKRQSLVTFGLQISD